MIPEAVWSQKIAYKSKKIMGTYNPRGQSLFT